MFKPFQAAPWIFINCARFFRKMIIETATGMWASQRARSFFLLMFLQQHPVAVNSKLQLYVRYAHDLWFTEIPRTRLVSPLYLLFCMVLQSSVICIWHCFQYRFFVWVSSRFAPFGEIWHFGYCLHKRNIWRDLIFLYTSLRFHQLQHVCPSNVDQYQDFIEFQDPFASAAMYP